jgi:hypothetical protein
MLLVWVTFVLGFLYVCVPPVIFHLGGFPTCHVTLNCGQTGCLPSGQLALRLARKSQELYKMDPCCLSLYVSIFILQFKVLL